MLVLLRQPGESIYVGEDIKIKVVNAKGRNIYIGIQAPPEIEIDREEIRERKRRGLPPPVKRKKP